MTLLKNDGLDFSSLALVLRGKKVLLGVSGSIAAFKAQDIVRGLRECGAEVRVALTENARQFVTPLTMETLSGQRVVESLWGGGETVGTHHIDHARWADAILIAPATANVIGKLANGIADDFITTEVLAFPLGDAPLLIAPAMNPQMAAHPAVRSNLNRLAQWGAILLGPVSGKTSCGEVGEGRMMEPEDILLRLASVCGIQSRRPNSQRILITMGPTLSRLDPIRYLSNRSSGKMGAALAWSAHALGYEVTVVTGPTRQALPTDARVIRVETAQHMFEAVKKEWSQSYGFAGAAAVLDFEFAAGSEVKLKKGLTLPESLAIRETPDILAWVCANKTPQQRVLGFAAETDAHLSNAYEKLLKKGCDAIFMNDVSQSDRGFESAHNGGVLIRKDHEVPFDLMPKAELADRLIRAEFLSPNVFTTPEKTPWKSSEASPT